MSDVDVHLRANLFSGLLPLPLGNRTLKALLVSRNIEQMEINVNRKYDGQVALSERFKIHRRVDATHKTGAPLCPLCKRIER